MQVLIQDELLLLADDLEEVRIHGVEASAQVSVLRALAAGKRDALRVFAHAHEREAKIGLATLLGDVERDERPAEPVRDQASERRVRERGPEHVARDRYAA